MDDNITVDDKRMDDNMDENMDDKPDMYHNQIS
jgi:hypothetical protein